MADSPLFPDCFDSFEQYDLWCDSAEGNVDRREAPAFLAGICFDCTLPYKVRMQRAGRCMRPDTVFVWLDGDPADPEPRRVGMRPSDTMDDV